MEEPIPELLGPEPGWTQETVLETTDYPYDFLIIDSSEYLNINYFDPGFNVWAEWDTVTLDLNEDQQIDIQFNLRYRNFLNGGSYQQLKFQSINPNCSIIGTFHPDSVATWITYNEETEIYEWRTILYNPADSMIYDSLKSLKVQHIVELPILQIGDTIALNHMFEYRPEAEYVFRNKEYDHSAPWYDIIALLGIYQGIWGQTETGYVGFKITGTEKYTIGWFKVNLYYERIKIEQIAYIEIDI
jgi:hypothetical protein